MLFNYTRAGFEKILNTQHKDVYVSLLDFDKDLSQLEADTGFNEMKLRHIMSRLDELGLTEYRVDSSMGSDRIMWKAKYTASELRKIIARRVLQSMIDEFGKDLLDVVIEELQARPAAAATVRDALDGV